MGGGGPATTKKKKDAGRSRRCILPPRRRARSLTEAHPESSVLGKRASNISVELPEIRTWKLLFSQSYVEPRAPPPTAQCPPGETAATHSASLRLSRCVRSVARRGRVAPLVPHQGGSRVCRSRPLGGRVAGPLATLETLSARHWGPRGVRGCRACIGVAWCRSRRHSRPSDRVSGKGGGVRRRSSGDSAGTHSASMGPSRCTRSHLRVSLWVRSARGATPVWSQRARVWKRWGGEPHVFWQHCDHSQNVIETLAMHEESNACVVVGAERPCRHAPESASPSLERVGCRPPAHRETLRSLTVRQKGPHSACGVLRKCCCGRGVYSVTLQG